MNMAEDEKTEQKNHPSEGEKKSLVSRLLHWLPFAVVIIVGAATGFTCARMLARTPKTPEQQTEQTDASSLENLKADGEIEEMWFVDLEPVIANLDEPSVTRYVRAAITLEISSEIDPKKGMEYIEKKKPLLTDWLMIYLAGLNLENTRGDRNLKRIQAQICDAFNEKLFPDTDPLIKRILFKEFAVQ
jgi:flagellar basal body-associated protein FliL